jgi:hypothetical protein
MIASLKERPADSHSVARSQLRNKRVQPLPSEPSRPAR